MNDREIRNLVDSYLLHQISPENKARLLDRMEADPVFAQYVKECEETTRVLHLARDRELHKKLNAWDEMVNHPHRRKGKGLLTLFILISLFIAGGCWLNYYYSPITIALRSFNDVAEKAIPLYEKKSSTDEWQLGLTAFRNKDFEKAMLHYLSIPVTNDLSMDALVRWNILLCRLALNGPTADWKRELRVLSENSPEPVRSSSEKLKREIQSPLTTFLSHGMARKTMTSIKPKII